MNKKYIVITSIVVVASVLGVTLNKMTSPNNTQKSDTVSFTTQSADKALPQEKVVEIPKKTIATCPTSVDSASKKEYEEQGYLPIGAELLETKRNIKTSTITCHYKDPITDQAIPGSLHYTSDEACTVPNIVGNTVRC